MIYQILKACTLSVELSYTNIHFSLFANALFGESTKNKINQMYLQLASNVKYKIPFGERFVVPHYVRWKQQENVNLKKSLDCKRPCREM